MGLWAVILAFLALGRSLCSPGCRYTEDCASSDVFVCDGCLDGFFEAAGLCLACSTVAEHCAACTLGTSGSVVCTLCEEGFGLSSGACESESETLGVASAAELSTFGVDLDEQRRDNCGSVCLSCFNPSYCYVCHDGFYLDLNSRCQCCRECSMPLSLFNLFQPRWCLLSMLGRIFS
eukprot:TRINITY_DN4156_c0_g1_i14.p1 TRINITY_DN4156_c0_g1~~TRINITY_DN4156_c0_g1_i14.p1  ORF type:complete len:177 (+),score=17.17 TRINITY_DN4156_c0_g1_i14:1-531(+)